LTEITAGVDNNVDDLALAGALQSDEKIIAAGYSNYITAPPPYKYGTWTLARYNTNGTLDTTFGSGGIVVDDFAVSYPYQRVHDVAIQASGKIVTVGTISVSPNHSSQTWAMARFNSNGSIDTSFGGCDGKVILDTPGYREEAYAVVIQPTDQKIFAGGTRREESSSGQTLFAARFDGGDDSPPCNAPTNLRAVAVPTNQINLTWQDTNNNEDGFQIERKTGAGGIYSEIATVGVNATSYSDTTGLSATTEYWYRVRPYNSSGNGSYSNEDATNTSCTGVQEGFETGNFSYLPWVTGGTVNWAVWNVNSPPYFPHLGTFYASPEYFATGSNYLQVTRTVEAGAICFYRRHWTAGNISILRFLVDGFLFQAWTGGDVPYTPVSFSIPAGTHTFRWEWVKNQAGDPTGVALIDDITFPPSNEPNAPSNLSATAISASQINLGWTDNSSNESGFKIERKTGIGGTYSQIATVGANVTTYSNTTGLDPSTQYCYRVRSYNANGDSPYSNESCATTPNNETPAKFRVERSTGKVYADGSYNCGQGTPGAVDPPAPPCFNSGTGADLAEHIDASEALEPGDVAEPDPNNPKHYRKVRTPYSTSVAGVISTQPGMTLAVAPSRPLLELAQDTLLTLDGASLQLFDMLTYGTMPLLSLRVDAISEAENAMALSLSVSQVSEQRSAPPRLALLGRVPVKVTTENGAIRAGDILTTSATRPGYAMRCADLKQCEGAVIGKALEALDEGTGIILMLIMR
jgi:uncharacterized delta-60 repeat protein